MMAYKSKYKTSHVQLLEDVPQNVVEMRKLMQNLKFLDKAEAKTLSRINGDKHLMKLKYRELLNNQSHNELEDAHFLQPGFRFRSNGDIRVRKDPRVVKAAEIMTSLTRKGILSDRHSEKPDVESELESAKVINYHVDDHLVLIDDTNHEEIDLVALVNEESYATQPCKTKHSLATGKHPEYWTPRIDVDVPKFLKKKSDAYASGKSLKSNCIACHFRLMQGEQDHIDVRKIETPVKRWESAPRGVYVPCASSANLCRPSKMDKRFSFTDERLAAELEGEDDISALVRKMSSKIAQKHSSFVGIDRQEATALAKKQVTQTLLRRAQLQNHLRSHPEVNTAVAMSEELNDTEEISEDDNCFENRYGYSTSASAIENVLRHGGTSSKASIKISQESLTRMKASQSEGAEVKRRPSKASSAGQQGHRGGNSHDNLDALAEHRGSWLALKEKASLEQMESEHKVQEFLGKLPAYKSSIPRWRDSTGSWHNSICRLSQESKHTEGAHEESCHEAQAPFHSSERIKLELWSRQREDLEDHCHERNSVGELGKCRYLRIPSNHAQPVAQESL